MRAVTRAALLAAVAALLGAPPVLAGHPVDGHERRFEHDKGDSRRILNYHYDSSSYDTWFKDAVEDALADWDNQNSRIPSYNRTSSAGGTVFNENQTTSPCTGRPGWIGCNDPHGDTAFNSYQLHFRRMPTAKTPGMMWQETRDTCTDYAGDDYDANSCFSLHRVVVHESEHNTLTYSHDDQGGGVMSEITVMPGETPSQDSGNPEWNTHHFLDCDESAALLEYGVLDPSEPYPPCFGGAEFTGVETEVAVSGTYFSRCTLYPTVTVAGRLQVRDGPPYQYLRETPLQGRVVKIYRKSSGSSSWPATPTYTATASGAWSGTNWSRAFTSSSAGTWNYKAVYDGAEAVLQPSPADYWTIQWVTSPCPD